MNFCYLQKNLSDKCGKQLLDAATKNRLYALKAASKKVAHKAAEAAGEFMGNKISEVANSHSGKTVKYVDKIIIPPEKIKEILSELRKVL